MDMRAVKITSIAILAAMTVLGTAELTALAGDDAQPLKLGTAAVPFKVRDCTGPAAGKRVCYFCRYGRRPIISIFTRELNPDVIQLVRQVDRAVAQNSKQRLAALVVFVTKDTNAAEQRLKSFAKKHQIATPLTIFDESGEQLERDYKVAPNTGLSVMLWNEGTLRSYHAFSAARLQPADIREIIAETGKILD